SAAKDILDLTLYTSAEALRIATALLASVMPESTAKIWSQLGMTEPLEAVRVDALTWGQLKGGQRVGEISAVFPRIDLKEAIGKMRALEAEVSAQQAALLGKAAPAAAVAGEADSSPAQSTDGRISIDDFSRIDLRVGLVLSAEPVKGADKLLHLKVDIGEPEPRTIVAGGGRGGPPRQKGGGAGGGGGERGAGAMWGSTFQGGVVGARERRRKARR